MISSGRDWDFEKGWQSRTEAYSHGIEHLFLTGSSVGRKLLVVVDDELPYFHLSEDGWAGLAELNIHSAAIELFKLVREDPAFVGIAYLQLIRKDADRGAWKKSILESELISLCAGLGNVQEVYVFFDHAAGEDGTFTPAGGFLRDSDSPRKIGAGLSRALNREVSLRVSFLAKAKVEAPGIAGFVKSSFSLSIGVPAKVRAWLGLPDHRGDVTGVVPEDWARLRRLVPSLNERLSGPQEMYWQRHWPSGGGGEKSIQEDALSAFEYEISAVLGTTSTDERFHWREGGWACPPLRALAQQCRDGRDLSKCLALAVEAIRDLFERWNSVNRVRVELVFATEEIKNDYLWFNAPALSCGLLELADSFCHEAKDRIDGHPNKLRFAHEGAWGVFSISVSENLQGQRFEIVISEQLRSSRETNLVQALPIPDEGEFEAMRGIERQFSIAGCQRILCDETLCLIVKADVLTHGPFSVWVIQP